MSLREHVCVKKYSRDINPTHSREEILDLEHHFHFSCSFCRAKANSLIIQMVLHISHEMNIK